MPSRVIKTPADLADWCRYMGNLEPKYPITATWKLGNDRSDRQNALSFKWFKEISEQRGDQEPWEVRAYCKLEHGVKMLHSENEAFREQWNRLIRGRFTYEELLELMVPPHDYPVSRIMTTKQMTKFLDAIYNEYSALGVRLTLPEAD